MRDYKDVKKRLSALAVCGLLVFSTYASDIQLIAENGDVCESFVDNNSYDESGVLIVDEEGNAVPDGYCDTCGRDLASHLSGLNEETEPVEEVQEEATQEHVHSDADEDGYCDGCGEVIEVVEEEIEETPISCEHIDENADLVCDLCGAELEAEEEEAEECLHEDADLDGYCDICGEAVEIEEEEVEEEIPCEHEDAECDGICDLCGEELPLMKQIFSDNINGKIVSVQGPMPRGCSVTIEPYTDWLAERIINNNYDEDFEVFEAYDINIYDADGNIYQPMDDDNTVNVTIAGVDEIAETPDEDIQVLRINETESGQVESVEELEVTDVTGDAATFETEHFTIVVVGTSTTLSNSEANMDSYRILCQSGAASQASGYMSIDSADIHLNIASGDTVQFYAYVRRGFTNLAQPMADGETIATGYYSSDSDASFDTSTGGWKNINISFSYEAGADKYFKSGAYYAVVLKFFDSVSVESGIGSVGTTYVALSETANTFVTISDYAGAIKLNTTESSTIDDVTSIAIQSDSLNRAITSNNTIYYMVGEEDVLKAVLTPSFDRDVTWSFLSTPSCISFNSLTGTLSSTAAETRTIEAKISDTVYKQLEINYLDVQLADDTSGTNASSSYTTEYTGSAIEPKVYSVKNGQGIDSSKGSVGSISSSSYSDNVNAGTASVSFPYTKDGTTYTFTKTFTITKKELTASNFAGATFTVDTTDDMVTAVSGATSGITGVDLTLGDDYTVTLSNRKTTASGLSYTVHIDAVSDGNYSGSFNLTSNYTITASNGLALSDYFQIYWDNGNIPQRYYTGSAITIPKTSWSGTLVILDEDGNSAYDMFNDTNVTYTNNTEAGNAKMSFSLAGYTGTIDLTFKINAVSLASATVDINGKGSGASYKYTGSAITPDSYGTDGTDQITVTLGGKTLVKGTDYTVSYNSTNINVGTATATITGKGNYKGTATQTFSIVASLALNTTIDLNGYEGNKDNSFATGYSTVYTGSPIDVSTSVEVYINGDLKSSGTDYTIACWDNKEGTSSLTASAGTKYIIITGLGDYAGESIVGTYSVTKANIQTSGSVKLLWNSAGSKYNSTKKSPVYEYTGNEITLSRDDYTFTYKGNALTLGTDFDITYVDGNNVNAGTVSVTFTGMGNYTGSKTLKFVISPATLTASMITLSPASGTYTGSKWEPSVEVIYNSKTVSASNYDVDYGSASSTTQLRSVNTDPGWPVVVTGSNNFTGSATVYFKINSKSSADLTFTINNIGATTVDDYNYCAGLNWIYTGKKHSGTLVIKDGSTTLEEGTDYVKTFKNTVNVNDIAKMKTAGTLSSSAAPCVVITGMGNYSGINNTIYFDIEPRPITGSGVNITYTANQTYTGSDVTPTDFAGVETSTDLYNGSYTLEEGIDFDVTYPDTVDKVTAGSGKEIVITGKGNYTGTITGLTYSIGHSLSDTTLTVTNPISNTGFSKVNGTYQVPYMGERTPVTSLAYSGTALTENADYTIERVSLTKDNSTTDIYNSYADTNLIQVTCTGKNNYYGTITYSYMITRLSLTKAVSELTTTKDFYVYVSDSNDWKYQYNGSAQDCTGLKIEYVYGDSTSYDSVVTAVKDTDYTLSSSADNATGKIGPAKAQYSVTASGVANGNFVGTTKAITESIVQADLAGATITVKDSSTILNAHKTNGSVDYYYAYYTGSPIDLTGSDFTVVKDGNTLVFGTDYKVKYENSDTGNGTNIGDATLTFYGYDTNSNYNSTTNGATFTFKILSIDAANDTGFTVSVGTAYKYTGSAIEPADITVKYNGTTLTKDTDYTISGYEDNIYPSKSAKVKVTGTGKYSGTKTANFEIYLDLSDSTTAKVTLDKTSYDINKTTGVATVTPTVQYKKTENGSDTWVTLPMTTTDSEQNYKVVIDGDGAEPGKHEVQVVGIDDGSYNCARNSVSFSDVQFYADLSAGFDSTTAYKAKYVTLSGTTDGDYAYTGGEVKPDISVLYSEVGITKSWSSDLTSVGEKSLTLTADSSSQYYKSGTSVTLKFTVKYDLSSATQLYTTISGVEQASVYYTGSVFNLGTDIGIAGKFGSDTTQTNLYGTFVTATTPYDIKNVDTYTITVLPKSDAYVMGGPVYLSFEVKGKTFDTGFTITIGGVDYTNGGTYITTYTGSEIKPSVVITNTSVTPNTVLTSNDYSVSYTNNVYEGTATVTITGLGGYKGSTATYNFTIEKKAVDSDVKVNVGTTYYAGDKVTLTPSIEVKYNGKVLTEGTDYEIVNKTNWNPAANDSAQTASFRVAFDSSSAQDVDFTGTNFTGFIDKTFTIEQLSVNSTNITIDQQSAEYTGATITKDGIASGLILKVGDTTLVQGSGNDYDVAILDQNNKDITSAGITSRGTYYILVSGNTANHCKDQRRITFTVTARSLAKNWLVNGNGTTEDGVTTASPIQITIQDYDDTYGFSSGKTAAFTTKQIEDGAIVITDSGVTTKSGGVKTLVYGTDYEIVSYKNNSAAGEGAYSETEKDSYGNYLPEEGTPYIIIKGMGDYMEEEVAVPFNIGKNINSLGATVTGSEVQYTYNGASQIPSLTITYGTNNLLSSSNYDVAVVDVTDENDPITDETASIKAGGANCKRLVITGKGAYYGTLYKDSSAKTYYTYTINPRKISPVYSYKKTYVNEANSDAVVEDPTLTFAVTWNGEAMDKLTQADLDGFTNGSNYTDYIGYYYAVYDNATVEPTITITDNGLSSTSKVLSTDDYTVEYSNNSSSSNKNGGYIGCASITLKGNYTTTSDGVSTQLFKVYYLILPTNLEKSTFEIVYTPGEYDWTGNAVKPDIVVQNTKNVILNESTDGGTTGDYTIDWGDNISPGTVTFTVNGINNYTGTKTGTFTIVADIQQTTIVTPKDGVTFDVDNANTYDETDTVLPTQLYTGETIRPTFKLILKNGAGAGKNVLLTENTDYTYDSVSTNEFLTSGTVSIYGNGTSGFYGQKNGAKTATFDIDFDPTLIVVSNYKESYQYTGSDIKPEFVLTTPDGTTLSYDSDDVVYKAYDSSDASYKATDSVVDIGKYRAEITVTLGKKTATKAVDYKIVARSLSDSSSLTVLYTKTPRYTGSAVTPSVTVYMKTDSGLKKIDSSDYTVSYANNVNCGDANITITGNGGNFTGVGQYTFRIIPGKPAMYTPTTTSNTISLEWVNDIYASGVKIRWYDEDGTQLNEAHTTGTTYTITGLEQGKTYTVKLWSYIGDSYYIDEDYGVTKTCVTGMGKATLTATSTTKGKAKITWTDDSGVTAYYVYRSTSATGDGVAVAVMPASTGSYTDSSLESGKTYYYYVIGYKYVNGKRVDGARSDAVSVTVK